MIASGVRVSETERSGSKVHDHSERVPRMAI
jgi:hypothetical protein